jgi:sulfur carrier protein ThiS
MTIEITLFGFGDDRPARFNGRNRLQIDIETPASPLKLLQAVGIEDTAGLILMNADRVIPFEQWDESSIQDQTTLTIMSALEGG